MNPNQEGKRTRFGALLASQYGRTRRRFRTSIYNLILKSEGGPGLSLSARDILRKHYQVEVGLFAQKGGLVPGVLNPMTSVGRFSSISASARTFNANHPQALISTHAFFFNPSLGVVPDDLLSRTKLNIGHDVTIGINSVVTASVSEIGTGAQIGHSSVVFQNIPPYAIVQGNPGRIVDYRYPHETVERLIESKWWEKKLGNINNILKRICA